MAWRWWGGKATHKHTLKHTICAASAGSLQQHPVRLVNRREGGRWRELKGGGEGREDKESEEKFHITSPAAVDRPVFIN